MITEDYVSYETAKLLKEKGFDEATHQFYKTITYLGTEANNICIKTLDGIESEPFHNSVYGYDLNGENTGEYACPTLQMAMKWLRDAHNVLAIPDYDYECTDKSYCYKIYKLGENGKPERVPIEGVSYDMLGEPHTEIVAYRDYKRSYSDYKTYEEACEAGIKYCLENLI